MQDQDILSHVRASARLAGVPLSPERVAAVAQHFGRTLAMARLLDTAELPPELELAEIYCPAPFPAHDAASLTDAHLAPSPETRDPKEPQP